MLAEILVFSLLSGSATLFHAYRVFVDPVSASELKLKLVETILFGTAPAIIGIVLGLPIDFVGDRSLTSLLEHFF